jgi:hypothetical protein
MEEKKQTEGQGDPRDPHLDALEEAFHQLRLDSKLTRMAREDPVEFKAVLGAQLNVRGLLEAWAAAVSDYGQEAVDAWVAEVFDVDEG